jgi:hypothetical protein
MKRSEDTKALIHRLVTEVQELRRRRDALAASLAEIDAQLAAVEELRAIGSPRGAAKASKRRRRDFSPGELQKAVLAAVAKNPGLTAHKLIGPTTAALGRTAHLSLNNISSTLGRLHTAGAVTRVVARKSPRTGHVNAYAYTIARPSRFKRRR